MPEDISGQVHALLSNGAYEYASARLGVSKLTGALYRKVFTVKLGDVQNFVDEHQLNLEEFASRHFWVSLVRSGEHWALKEFHPGEKGPSYEDETLFTSYTTARSALLKEMLHRTQTGIAF